MSYKPYYARKTRRWPYFLFFAIAALGLWKYAATFYPQKLVENSELKQRGFSSNVEEIVAPQSGIKAYLMTEKSNPIVSMSFIFADSGSAYDVAPKNGLSGLTAQMLTEGAGKLDSQHFKEELENYAISIVFGAEKDDFSGSLLTIKDNLPRATELLRLSLFEPRLDNDDLRRLQLQTVQAADRVMETPNGRLKEAARKIIFGQHAYGKGIAEVRKDILKIQSDDIRQLLKQRFSKDRLYIGIAGDISVDEAQKLVDDVFGDLPETSNLAALKAPEIDYSFRSEDIVEKDIPQVLSSVVAPSVARLSKDFYPLYIANYIFGGAGLNSRLNQAAREKEGLTYGIYTGMQMLKQSPQLVGSFSTTPENFARVKEIFVTEWNKMGQDGISEKELKVAKSYMQSSYNLRFADINTLSASLAGMQREKLGIDFLKKRNSYIEEITLSRVNRVAKKYFSPDNMFMVNLGKIEQERN